MNKQTILFGAILAALNLTACGGSSSGSTPVVEKEAEPTVNDIIYGPLSTGSVSEPSFVYFDLETMSVLTLTEEEAQANTQWDIAFKRSSVYLNNANSDSPVAAYFTGHNEGFFDADGEPISESFINATPDSELTDFTAVTIADVPEDAELFASDVTNSILDGFYNYDSTTHVITAADTNYFIVSSDDTYSKMRVTDITTSGRAIGTITLSYANQMSSDTEFSATESTIVVDAASACAGYNGVYVDFDLGQVVAAGDAWDVSLPCSADNTAAEFSMDIADDATAMQDFDNDYAAIDLEALRYYDFEANEYSIKAFDANVWYEYGLNGGHTLWSEYGVYLIKTADATYKFQITSYYNESNESGNISFRAEAL